MTKRVQDIIENVRALSPEEQRDVLINLLELVDGEPDGTPEEIEQAWLEEVQRRIAEAERGDVTFISEEEAMAPLRAGRKRA